MCTHHTLAATLLAAALAAGIPGSAVMAFEQVAVIVVQVDQGTANAMQDVSIAEYTGFLYEAYRSNLFPAVTFDAQVSLIDTQGTYSVTRDDPFLVFRFSNLAVGGYICFDINVPVVTDTRRPNQGDNPCVLIDSVEPGNVMMTLMNVAQ